MRKLLITTLILCLLPLSFSFAQDYPEETKRAIFYGVDFESNFGVRSGATFQIGTSDFYAAPYFRIGLDTASFETGLSTSKAAGVEFAWNVWSNPTSTIDLYLLAGAGLDWTTLAAENPQFNLTYGTEAAGALLVIDLSNNIPLIGWVFTDPKLGAWAKYRPQLFESNSLWRDKFSGGFLLLNSI